MTSHIPSPRAINRALGRVQTPYEGALVLAARLWGTALDAPDWHEHAACRGTSSELWFGEARSDYVRRRRESLCASCPVFEQCRADQQQWEATDSRREHFGFFAGETADQRAARSGLNDVALDESA